MVGHAESSQYRLGAVGTGGGNKGLQVDGAIDLGYLGLAGGPQLAIGGTQHQQGLKQGSKFIAAGQANKADVVTVGALFAQQDGGGPAQANLNRFGVEQGLFDQEKLGAKGSHFAQQLQGLVLHTVGLGTGDFDARAGKQHHLDRLGDGLEGFADLGL